MIPAIIIKSLLRWYNQNARDLPWRNIRDPYKIWLSEIILQQTRVNQGLPYFLNFLKKFPTLESLASASENEVLRQWQGLGYYSRARNIHKCSRVVHEEFNGIFPNSYDVLLKLPGIGPYTAAAIAAFAFLEPVAAVDGNAIRVYSRLFGIKEDTSKNSTVSSIRKLANESISRKHPDIYNQAIMELGATVCLPKNPNCPACPLSSGCYALLKGVQDQLPVKKNKLKSRPRHFNYIILRKGKTFAMFERNHKDIWKGLYDFYLLESDRLLEPEEITDPFISEALIEGGKIDMVADEKKHVLSHQVIYSRFFEVSIPENLLKEDMYENHKLNFYSKKEILDLPKSVLVNNFLNYYFDNMDKRRGKNSY